MSTRASTSATAKLDEDQAVRLEDYVNDQLQTYADLEGLDALLENVKTQQDLLRKQLHEAEGIAKQSAEAMANHIEDLKKSTKEFQGKQEGIDRRLLILTRSDTGEEAVRRLTPVMDKLQQLEIAQSYFDILAEVDDLSSQARSQMKASPQEALKPYLRIKQLSKALRQAQPLAEDAAPHLVDHVEGQSRIIWDQMKDAYGSKFEQTLKSIKWPGKDVALDGPLVTEWERGVSGLLDLQIPSLLEHENETPHTQHAPALLPLEIMVTPLEMRFKYHFEGDRPTNRIDKPEFFLSHVVSLLTIYENFLISYLQPVLSKKFKDMVLSLNPSYVDALSAFITALLPMLRTKLRSLLPQLSSQPQLFSHLIHELIAFDNGLRDDWGYSDGTAAESWKGLTWEVLDKTGWNWFPSWLQIEKDFALSRYESIISEEDGGEIDFDSVDPGVTKPTKSAFRVNDLLETITDRYRELPSFYQKVQFLIMVQISVFDKFHERLHSSLEAYLTMTSSVGRTVQGVSKEEQAQLQGIQGLDRLCRIYGSSEYLERKMQDWSDDVFFLELWDEIQYMHGNREEGGSIGGTLTFEEIAERTSKGLGTEDRGALFDETRGAYRRLRIRTESVILDLVISNVREALKPFGRANTWASRDADFEPAQPGVSGELDSALEILGKYLEFLSRVLAELTLRRISRNLATAVQTWIWDNVLMRHQFSAAGSMQLKRDIGALESAMSRYTGASLNRPSMRKISEAAGLLNLPARRKDEEQQEDDEDAWNMDDEDTGNGTPDLTIHVVERRIFHNNESAREVLDELGIEALTETDARNVLGKRIDLDA